MIVLEEITRSFDDVNALDKLSLEIPRGRIMGIIGPGGAGKSTLCKVACGLVRPDSGNVIFDGVSLSSLDRGALREVHRRCGVQFQNDALFEHMTVLDNISYPLRRLTSLSEPRIRQSAMERLAMVGLAGFEERLPSMLSGGQRRRVALARACVTDPDVLICDDPTAGLDPVTSRRILDMIAGIRYQAQNTVVVVSSDVLGLLSVVERVGLIWDGKLAAHGTPASFWADTSLRVRRFLDDARIPFEGLGWA